MRRSERTERGRERRLKTRYGGYRITRGQTTPYRTTGRAHSLHQSQAHRKYTPRPQCSCRRSKTNSLTAGKDAESHAHVKYANAPRHKCLLDPPHPEERNAHPCTFVCCDPALTHESTHQAHRPHLGAHRLTVVHTPQDTCDPRIVALILLTVIRGHNGPLPVPWSELSLGLVPAGTPTSTPVL